MIFGSVCSGIEAASTAWHPLGWTTAYVAEIEAFPCQVLAQRLGATAPRYLPDDVKPFRAAWGDRLINYGDFTRIVDEPEVPGIDVLVGGTPCQAFSIAGNRESLADDRGNLTLKFVELVHAHARRTDRPLRYAVWENVPGVLSTEDNAFGCFLAGLVGADAPLRVPGGGRWTDAGMVAGPLGRAAWRILDAQHIGLAQRRRRVFLVFCPAGTDGDPAAILFEREGVPGHFAPGSEAGEGVASTIAGGARQSGGYSYDDVPLAATLTGSDGGISGKNAVRGRLIDCTGAGVAGTLTSKWSKGTGGPAGDEHYNLIVPDTAPTLLAGGNGTGGTRPPGTTVDNCDSLIPVDIAHTLRADGFDASEDGTGRGTPPVACHAFDARQSDVIQYGDISGPLDTDGGSVGVLAPRPITYSMMPQNSGKDFTARAVDVAQPLMAAGPAHGNQGGDVVVQLAFPFDAGEGRGNATLTSNGDAHSGFRDDEGLVPVGFVQNQRNEVRECAIAGALAAEPGMKQQTFINAAASVRRLVPTECERLQGFPDDHTRIRIRHFKAQKVTRTRPADMWDVDPDGGYWLMAADGPRYKALGNSMATTVMSWIGQRIAAFEAGTLDTWRFDWSLLPWVRVAA